MTEGLICDLQCRLSHYQIYLMSISHSAILTYRVSTIDNNPERLRLEPEKCEGRTCDSFLHQRELQGFTASQDWA